MIVHTHVSNIKEEKPIVKEVVKKASKKKEPKFEEISSEDFIKKEEEEAFLSPLLSFSPNFMEKSTAFPIAKPMMIEVRNVMRVKEEPTAAKAFLPKKRPTIIVSAIL